MKKILLFTFVLILFFLVIKSCTTLNLSPKLLFKKADFKNFLELQDTLQTNAFLMYRVTQTNNNNIRYFPDNNFFLISNLKRLGHFNPIKIDGLGNKVFELDLDEKHPFHYLETINCFVIGADSIYDFSDENPAAAKFASVLNRDLNFTDKDWIETFDKLYSTSNIVLYGYYTETQSAAAVYFLNNGKWIKLYTSLKVTNFIYPASGSKIECKVNGKIMPHKWHNQHYLKDVANATYSNEHRYTDAYITPFNTDNVFFPDQRLKYTQKGTIEMLAFEKETYTTEGYYNPGIPVNFYGTGYYTLTLNNSVLEFKTIASKESFAKKTNTNLYLFEVPTNFSTKTQVRFLTYDYDTNFYENNKKGTYVIKIK